jgi:hypothetical protein
MLIPDKVCLTSLIVLGLTMVSIHFDERYIPKWRESLYGALLLFSGAFMLLSGMCSIWVR